MNARELFTAMIENDLSRQTMDAKVDEVRLAAHKVDDPSRRRMLLETCNAIMDLMNADEKLALANVDGTLYNKAYSTLPTAKEQWKRI